MVTRRKLALKPVAMLVLLFVLGGVTGVCATLAFVQDREARSLRAGPSGFEERRMKGLARRLDLDDDQREQVRALVKKNREEVRALGKKLMGECGKPLAEQREAFDASMKKILRPDQVTRYDELQKERHAWGGPPGDFGGGPPPPPFP